MKNREKKRVEALKKINGEPKVSKGQQRKDKKLLQRLRRKMRTEREQAAVVYNGWIDKMQEGEE